MSSSPRVAMVTGGNRGIGFEICRQLGDRGFSVLLTSRDADKGRAACEQLTAAGIRAESIALEICDADQIRAVADHVSIAHGGLDALINNAGISISGFDERIARATIATNFTAAMRVTDAMAPLLRPGGRIVMVSSGMGDRGMLGDALAAQFRAPMTREQLVAAMDRFVTDVAAGTHSEEGWPSSAYRVSKIGMTKLAEVIARELEADGNPRRMLCNSSCPGWVRTDMGGPHATRSIEDGADTPVWLATLPDDGPQGGFFRDRAPADW